jgi:hypothetical protein
MWVRRHRRPTSPAAAAFPLNRFDESKGRAVAQRKSKDDLTPDELEDQECEELPERQAMSLIDANVATPVNAAAALNVLSDDSTAVANAEQSTEIQQSQ